MTSIQGELIATFETRQTRDTSWRCYARVRLKGHSSTTKTFRGQSQRAAESAARDWSAAFEGELLRARVGSTSRPGAGHWVSL